MTATRKGSLVLVSAALAIVAVLGACGPAMAGLSNGSTRAQVTEVGSIPKRDADEVTSATKTPAVPAEAKDKVRAGKEPVETTPAVRSRPHALRHRDSAAVTPRLIRRDPVRTAFATIRPFGFGTHCHGWR